MSFNYRFDDLMLLSSQKVDRMFFGKREAYENTMLEDVSSRCVKHPTNC